MGASFARLRPIEGVNPTQEFIPVPRGLLTEVIEGLWIGADAVLDRDWSCYSEEERADAQRFVDSHFVRLIRVLEDVAQDT